MQETTAQLLTAPEATSSLVASAERAAAWAGEPFLHPDEDSGQVLAPGTARRRALDDALAEIDAGSKEPSSDWKIRYALMLMMILLLPCAWLLILSGRHVATDVEA